MGRLQQGYSALRFLCRDANPRHERERARVVARGFGSVVDDSLVNARPRQRLYFESGRVRRFGDAGTRSRRGGCYARLKIAIVQ